MIGQLNMQSVISIDEDSKKPVSTSAGLSFVEEKAEYQSFPFVLDETIGKDTMLAPNPLIANALLATEKKLVNETVNLKTDDKALQDILPQLLLKDKKTISAVFNTVELNNNFTKEMSPYLVYNLFEDKITIDTDLNLPKQPQALMNNDIEIFSELDKTLPILNNIIAEEDQDVVIALQPKDLANNIEKPIQNLTTDEIVLNNIMPEIDKENLANVTRDLPSNEVSASTIKDLELEQIEMLKDEEPVVALPSLAPSEKINIMPVEKELKVNVAVNTATTSNNTTSQQLSTGFGSLEGNASKDSSSSNQGQNSNQKQTEFQQLNQIFTKMALSQAQQVMLSQSAILTPDVERTDRLLADLGIGLDKRSELPSAMRLINTSFGSYKWSNDFGQRLIYMANKNIQEAKISLNPEKLGPLQVKLHFDKDQQLQVSILAQHGVTRELLENALPRLRELLENANINVANVDVGKQELFDKQNNNQDSSDKETINTGATNEDEVIETKVVGSSDNLIDYYV